ncbi:hypothetical protein [Roseibium sp. MMSF_3412]|uniref:hypothetical protein n=1 Tax=Roseibium sp. MMSF_3412 TaxID=3046712 RepID=UPI00273E2D57|nr:hypothetical protein [Roseibium sp. MMSF_3412]
MSAGLVGMCPRPAKAQTNPQGLWINTLTGCLTLSGETGRRWVRVHLFALLCLGPSLAPAGNWKEADVPANAKSVQSLAIGDDGRLYSVSSNRHGYFFRSILPIYRFEVSMEKGHAGQLVARRNIVFLAESCDAYTPERTGYWTRRGSRETYRLTIAGKQAITFQLLSEDLDPRHTCSAMGPRMRLR